MSDITHTTALQHQMPKSSDFRSSFKYENVKVKHNGNEKYPMKLNGDQGLSISKNDLNKTCPYYSYEQYENSQNIDFVLIL